MSDFDDFLTMANTDAADIMGEYVTVNGQTLKATFDEQSNPWDLTEHGQHSIPTVKIVIPTVNLTTIPKKAQRIIRVATNETFIITEVDISTGNVEITAQNETKRDG